MHITVSNLLGQKIMEENAEGHATLDLSHLVPGIYTIKAEGFMVRFVKE